LFLFLSICFSFLIWDLSITLPMKLIELYATLVVVAEEALSGWSSHLWQWIYFMHSSNSINIVAVGACPLLFS
jgi:hypothetical protein